MTSKTISGEKGESTGRPSDGGSAAWVAACNAALPPRRYSSKVMRARYSASLSSRLFPWLRVFSAIRPLERRAKEASRTRRARAKWLSSMASGKNSENFCFQTPLRTPSWKLSCAKVS